jgi:hypothetical protein
MALPFPSVTREQAFVLDGESPLTHPLFPDERALCRAVENGDGKKARVLLEKGVSPDPLWFPAETLKEASALAKGSVRGKLPGAFHQALESGNIVMQDLLFPFVDVAIHGLDHLEVAVCTGNATMVSCLLAHPELPTPLDARGHATFLKTRPFLAMEPWEPWGTERILDRPERIILFARYHESCWSRIIHNLVKRKSVVEDLEKTDLVFDLLWAHLDQHGATDRCIDCMVYEPRPAGPFPAGAQTIRINPLTASRLSPHVHAVLWARFHAPNSWFSLLGQGDMALCRSLLGEVDWTLWTPIGKGPFVDSLWMMVADQARDRASSVKEWEKTMEAWCDRLPSNQGGMVPLQMLADMVGRSGRFNPDAARFWLGRIDEEELVDAWIHRTGLNIAGVDPVPLIRLFHEPGSGNNADPEIDLLLSLMGEESRQKMVDEFPERFPVTEAGLVRAVLGRAIDAPAGITGPGCVTGGVIGDWGRDLTEGTTGAAAKSRI